MAQFFGLSFEQIMALAAAGAFASAAVSAPREQRQATTIVEPMMGEVLPIIGSGERKKTSPWWVSPDPRSEIRGEWQDRTSWKATTHAPKQWLRFPRRIEETRA